MTEIGIISGAWAVALAGVADSASVLAGAAFGLRTGAWDITIHGTTPGGAGIPSVVITVVSTHSLPSTTT